MRMSVVSCQLSVVGCRLSVVGGQGWGRGARVGLSPGSVSWSGGHTGAGYGGQPRPTFGPSVMAGPVLAIRALPEQQQLIQA